MKPLVKKYFVKTVRKVLVESRGTAQGSYSLGTNGSYRYLAGMIIFDNLEEIEVPKIEDLSA